MRVGSRPETLVERLAGGLGLLPLPLLDTLPAMLQARSLIAASELGLFDALHGGPLAASRLATACGASPRGVALLCEALVGCGYLERAAATADGPAYDLAAVSRRFLLSSAAQSLHDSTIYRRLEWEWVAKLDGFVRDGEPLRIHTTMDDEQWGLYQRGMASLADFLAADLVPRLPVPPGATRLLDVGGAHGAYAVALCRRHPKLLAKVLDLPEAIRHAATLLAKALTDPELAGRVSHWAADVRNVELGEATFDVVLISQLFHHFDRQTAADLMRRAARALRPGGSLTVVELVRGPVSRRRRSVAGEQLASLLGLYFALTSESGLWSLAELRGFMEDAGLTVGRPRYLAAAPGVAVLGGRAAAS